MIIHVLAVDYDGTIATRGHVAPETAAALGRVRASGRKVVLVTGRTLPDLRVVCPDADRMFDVIVAENGGVMYLPDRREERGLGDAPERPLVEALTRRGIAFDLGTSIIATDERFAEESLAAVRETGVQRTLVFNKGSLMLVPEAVSKATGLVTALGTLELSPHNLVSIGDAENDHALLALAECSVAVADAIPALRERADYVTRAPGGAGVVQFIEQHVVTDLDELAPQLMRHRLELGRTADGEVVALSPHGTRLLVVGPSGSGKSSLTGVLVERLVGAGRSFCLLDPEGDYQKLAELEGVVVLGRAEGGLPTGDELNQLLRRPGTRLVLNLSAMSLAEKVTYGVQALTAIASVRSASGLPHWLIVDEAHHIFPVSGPGAELLKSGGESFCLITVADEHLSPAASRLINVVASTGDVPRGEAILTRPVGALPGIRFRVAQRGVEHRRHLRKYAQGELPPDRSFYFRGPDGRLNLKAANLSRFCELAEGLDEATWTHHLRRGDYSTWIRSAIKDSELADQVAAVESDRTLAPLEARRRAVEAVRQRYVA